MVLLLRQPTLTDCRNSALFNECHKNIRDHSFSINLTKVFWINSICRAARVDNFTASYYHTYYNDTQK